MSNLNPAVNLPVALYARYSTERQDARSIEDQIRRCRAFAAARGFLPVAEFSDAAQSGAHLERAGMQAILAEARKGKRSRFRAVLVDDLSRLSRDLGNTWQIVFRDLAAGGVKVIDCTTGMASDAPGARLVIGATALVNDTFLELVKTETHRGLEGRALAGFWTGGKLYGYRTLDEFNPPDPLRIRKRLVIDEREAGIIRRIFEQYAAGISVKEIARRLNADGIPPPSAQTKRHCTPGWGHSTIIAMIDNESYIGRFTWNRRKWNTDPIDGSRTYVERPKSEWRTRQDPALAIISSELWAMAAARRVESRRSFRGFATGPAKDGDGARGTPPRYLLSGLLQCACGSTVSVVGGKGGSRSYGCAGHKRDPRLCGNGLTVSKARLERSIIQALRHELSAPDLIARMSQRLGSRFRSQSSGASEELRIARADLAKANGALKNLLDLVVAGGVPASRATGERITAAEAERDRAEANVAAIQARPKLADVLPSPASLRAHVEALEKVLAADVELGRQFLRSHVGKITLTPINEGPKPRYRASGHFSLDPKVQGVAGAGFEPATFGL